MFKIKIINNSEIGYYCGWFNIDGERVCGYEENINNSKVKTYKKLSNAEKVLTDLLTTYNGVKNYAFEIVEV